VRRPSYIVAMSFPRQLLNQDEEVVLDVHPHWLFFAEPALSLAGLVILTIVLAATVGGAITGFMLLLVAAVLIWGLWRLVTWRTTHFVITSDRLIYRSGVLAKRGIQIPIERVNNVNFKQGILERFLGAGDLLVESAGQDGQQRFTDVRHPDQIQNIIHAQMDANERRMYTGMANAVNAPGVPAADLTTQLEKLEGMLQRGTLTRAEFDAPKHRLLGGEPPPPPPPAPLPPPPGASR
jgi:membrane protein YdbS with pleckstrin-like domain